MLLPTHTVDEPLIGCGVPSTVITVVLEQPVGSVYIMIADPAATPLTIPEPLIAATLVLLLLQVPPAPLAFSARPLPWHTVLPPVITPGSAFTVISVVL
jgi:hypothetical protein